MPLPAKRTAQPPATLYYVAWGLADIEWRIYKSKHHAKAKVAMQEQRGVVAQIWEVQGVPWTDISPQVSDPIRRQAGEGRREWVAAGGPLRRLIADEPNAIDFVQRHPRIETALTAVDDVFQRVNTLRKRR